MLNINSADVKHACARSVSPSHMGDELQDHTHGSEDVTDTLQQPLSAGLWNHPILQEIHS